MEVFGETALLIWSTPVIVALIIAEVLWTHFHQVKAYTLKETLTNCYLAALNGSFDILMRGVVLARLRVVCCSEVRFESVFTRIWAMRGSFEVRSSWAAMPCRTSRGRAVCWMLRCSQTSPQPATSKRKQLLKM